MSELDELFARTRQEVAGSVLPPDPAALRARGAARTRRRAVLASGAGVLLVVGGGLGGLALVGGGGASVQELAPPTVTQTTPAPAPATPTGPPATPPATPPVTTSPTDRSSSSSAVRVVPTVEPLRDGIDIGYLKDVRTSGGKTALVFDRIQFLTGPEGRAAAAADGQPFANDHYIRNTNPLTRQVEIAPDAKIEGSTQFNPGGAIGPEPRTLTELRDFVASDRAPSTPFDWTVQGGIVVQLGEHYIP